MFSSFISLGPHCATAASMSKYGLRSFKCFYEKVKETCSIRCFVDKGKAGGTVSGIPVVELERVDYSDDFCFVVTAVYDFQNIYEDIISKNVNARIISLQEILA